MSPTYAYAESSDPWGGANIDPGAMIYSLVSKV